jgi:hypothetical protein
MSQNQPPWPPQPPQPPYPQQPQQPQQPPQPQYPQQPYQPPQSPHGQQGYPPSPPNAPPTPPTPPKISVLSWISLAIALPAFLVGWIPFAGLSAIVGVILAIVDLTRVDGPPRSKTVSILSLVLGGMAMLAGGTWVLMAAIFKVSSCPHIYAFDGARWQLDADPLSGALLPGAERSDWDRLEHLAPVDGVYRVRITDDLEEIDRVDHIALLVVDHAPGSAALPTPDGAIVQVSDAAAPIRATDSHGREVTAQVLAADDDAFTGSSLDFDPAGPQEPRERLTVELPRPATGQAALVIRAHSSPFAEESFARYAARLGPGTATLMNLAQDASWYPYRARITDEMRRLGLPLELHVAGGADVEILPIGPAIQRDFAIPIEILAGTSPTVSITLEMTPRFWEIDRLALAAAPETLVPRRLLARQATGPRGTDALETLATADGRRVELHTGESVELEFEAPPSVVGRTRSVVAEIRGSYEMPFGGRGWLNPLAIVAHRRGWDSLPRFAGRLDRGR